MIDGLYGKEGRWATTKTFVVSVESQERTKYRIRYGGLAKKTLEQSTCTQSARTLNADGHTSFFRIENVKVSYALFDV